MGLLDSYEPKSVWKFFEEFSKIPHGSGNTKEISDYVVEFAKERGLKYRQDEVNNVVIFKDATEGYEKSDFYFVLVVCHKNGTSYLPIGGKCRFWMKKLNYFSSRIVGKSKTSRMLSTLQSIMQRRSMPKPIPPAGGMP